MQMADGRVYTLPAAADARVRESDGTVGGVLSPDGRWLVLAGCAASPAGNNYLYRDLTGTATSCRRGRPTAWSANGRWVLAGEVLVDLETGHSRPIGPVAADPSELGPRMAGILNDGTLVLTGEQPNPYAPTSLSPQPSIPASARAGLLTIISVRPTGDTRSPHRITAEVDAVFSAAEQHSSPTGWSAFAVRGDGSELVADGYAAGRGRVLARFSLADGRLIGTVPAPAKGVLWLLVGYAPDGGLLFTRHGTGAQVDLVEIALSGATRVLCSVPAGYQHALRYDDPWET
jgi:hypothetical protein